MTRAGPQKAVQDTLKRLRFSQATAPIALATSNKTSDDLRRSFQSVRKWLFEGTSLRNFEDRVRGNLKLRICEGKGMSIQVVPVSQLGAEKLFEIEEGQFYDVKAIEVSPSKLTKALSAFANADGGDLYVGIAESAMNGNKVRSWSGFKDQEAANGHLQCFEAIFPLGQDFAYELLNCPSFSGLVLHIQVNKTREIKKASNGLPYLRRGAQNLPINTTEALRQLERAKGITTFESETVCVDKTLVTESETIQEFIEEVVPRAEPEPWLKKQILVRGDFPTVGGVLLFADEPQAILPKRCGIKIYRYKSKTSEGFREALAFQPITIEGAVYAQIKTAVETTTEKIEEIPKMGDESLEQIKYPPEALHEIITNAVLHRDYSIADDVHIRIFDNRVEIQSPGRLPAHVTVKNILKERFARNGAVVRILNKFPNPPNKDVGEGLNTAFAAMHRLNLREPDITEVENSVLVTIRHESLASPEEAILDYLEHNPHINNSEAREVSHVTEDHRIRTIFRQMEARGLIERLPGSVTSNTRYRKVVDKNARPSSGS